MLACFGWACPRGMASVEASVEVADWAAHPHPCMPLCCCRGHSQGLSGEEAPGAGASPRAQAMPGEQEMREQPAMPRGIESGG